jgi:hypothetical protein
VGVVFVVGRFDEDRFEVFDLLGLAMQHSLTETRPTHLIVQARPEAVVDIAAPALLDHEPAESVFQSFYAFIQGDACAQRGVGIRLAVPERAVGLGLAAAPLPLSGLILVFLYLGIQARHDTLKAPKSVQELCILRLATLARRATRPREDAFNFGAQAIRAWMLLVALDLYEEGVKSACAVLNARGNAHH